MNLFCATLLSSGLLERRLLGDGEALKAFLLEPKRLYRLVDVLSVDVVGVLGVLDWKRVRVLRKGDFCGDAGPAGLSEECKAGTAGRLRFALGWNPPLPNGRAAELPKPVEGKRLDDCLSP